ncbi:MAG: HD domain-containing protein, partial [Clostridia bacterium]|nr:HD domain-containing protein [Clostridia bacterium]
MGKKKEMLQIFSDREVFYELIAALSLALDMDARGKLYHAWRVALAARETSRFFFPQGEVDVFFAGLLHDIGAMGLDDHIVHQMISGPDLANPIIQKHSEKGAQITGELPAFEKASLYILDHHENWDGTGFPLGKKGQEISKGGQIVAVADQFDILLRVHHYRADKALKQLQERSGRSLAAEAVEAFTVAMEEMGDFEALLHNESLGPLMAQAMKELPEVNCTHPNPIQASVHIFAKIIDAKHAYTAGHSQRVARYSVALGQELGLIEEELSELEVAGLLHDFGKISVPGSILDKPARLSSKEFAIIKKHPGRTAELLEIVQGLSKLAWVAGGHHERFD